MKLINFFYLSMFFLFMTNCKKNIENNQPIYTGSPSNLIAFCLSTQKVKLSWSYSSTIATSFKIERKTQGSFSIIANIDSLNFYIDSSVSENTEYTYRVLAYNNSGNSNYTNEVTIYTGSSTLPDINDTVRICSQTWNTKNLDVAYYRNGDPIPQVTNPEQWASLTTGAWCYYNNDHAMGAIYGKLYNCYAVNDPRGLAPAGWHIPSIPEIQTLRDCLSGATVAGGKMKETGYSHWFSPNSGATNSSGFTALPGGARSFYGSTQSEEYNSVGSNGFWYTSTSYFNNTNNFLIVGVFSLNNESSSLTEIGSGSNNQVIYNNAYSVRCLKGPAITIEITTAPHSNLSAISVQSGGFISNDGGYPITSRGVVWSTSPLPNINLGTKTVDGSGMGNFNSNINGLSPNTIYYIRAYATNITGTVYGNQDTINTTNYSIPTIITKDITLITHNSCMSGATSINTGNNPISSKGVVWSTSPNPTIALPTKTYDGTGSTLFNSSINGLSRNTVYYLRAYATNSAGTGYGNEISFRTSDIPSIVICSNVWTNRNLDVAYYRNGDPIPQVTDSAQWANLTTGAWCYYNNDPAMGAIYGKLYNWYAVNDSRGLAPAGWHVPNEAEWNSVIYCFSNNTTNCPSYNTSTYNTTNATLQSTGTIEAGTGLWHQSSSFVANNNSGFSALPHPTRSCSSGSPGGFDQTIGYNTEFWTSTPDQTLSQFSISFGMSRSWPNSPCGGGTQRNNGLSIRCVKD